MIALIVNLQMRMTNFEHIVFVPMPSFRINMASLFATISDMFFLAIAWELLGKSVLIKQLCIRSFLTLLCVMWLDVLLFTTGAFWGEESYFQIMKGTLMSRLIISIFSAPILYFYLKWQSSLRGIPIENRPILAIIKEFSEIKAELSLAQQEIEKRKQAEIKNQELINKLKQALSDIKILQGFLPICANCKKIRDDKGYWQQIEKYIQAHSDAKFTHAICPECIKELYPDLDLKQEK